MRDIDVFSKLLNLQAPWKVDRVSLAPQEHRLDVWLAHRRNASFPCPECGLRCPLYDRVPSRSWSHLDHGDCLTWLHAPAAYQAE
jgi:transposase